MAEYRLAIHGSVKFFIVEGTLKDARIAACKESKRRTTDTYVCNVEIYAQEGRMILGVRQWDLIETVLYNRISGRCLVVTRGRLRYVSPTTGNIRKTEISSC